MHYKTIILEMLTGDPVLHRQLQANPQLLHRLSAELKANHLVLVEQLAARTPATDSRIIHSQALELAVEEVRGRLSPSDSDTGEWAEEHLDDAMAFLRKHTPPE